MSTNLENNNSPILIYTVGDPTGIGPDLIIKLCQKKLSVPIVVPCCPNALLTRAKLLGLPLKIREYSTLKKATQPLGPGELYVHPLRVSESLEPGVISTEHVDFIIKSLKWAADETAAKRASALITGPVHKGIINQAGVNFSGHTEFLAERAKVSKVVMMLTNPLLKVALVTTHMPLADVPHHITFKNVKETISILHNDLKNRYGIASPKIYISGLNPHAGEFGHLGHEELSVIQPVINKLKAKGMDLHGPLAADTLFTTENIKKADAFLTMYHDQGLPVLKHCGFGRSVNVTLGLPYIRTSVDHGTALSIAGTGKANTGSLEQAIIEALAQVKREVIENKICEEVVA